jgi:nitrogen fixation NifU-like protein
VSKSALELYQDVVLSHNRQPCGYGEIASPTRSGEGFNPICGDQIKIQIHLTEESISQVGFTARCCALCRASASVLTAVMSGLSVALAEQEVRKFESMIQGHGEVLEGDAAAFAAVSQYPARAKCVVLPWRTFLSLLKATSVGTTSVTTESMNCLSYS